MDLPTQTIRDAIKEVHTAVQYEEISLVLKINLGENRRNQILKRSTKDALNYCSYNEIRLMRSLLSTDVFADFELQPVNA